MPESLPDVYRQTPTLLAGDTPGSQGEVRVWYPDRRRVKRELLFSMAFVAVLSFVASPLLNVLLPMASVQMILIVLGLAVSPIVIQAVRMRPREWKPGYRFKQLSRITNDSSGIALLSGDEVVALPWSDVVGWYDPSPQGIVYGILYTQTHGPVVVNFVGFRKATRQDLSNVIRREARLAPSKSAWPFSPHRFCYMRPGYRALARGEFQYESQAALPEARR